MRSGQSQLRFCLALLGLLALAPSFAQSDPPRGAFRAVVLSDFNGPYGATSYPAQLEGVVQAILEVWRPDLVLSAGDVIAGQNADLPPERFAAMWAAFEREVAAPLRAAGIPLAATIGNHDGSSLRRSDGSFAFAREREAARAYWTQQPLALDFLEHADFPFHYSFQLGGVFVAAWDASSAKVTEEQLGWLEGQLASPAARSASYRILLGHLPLYGVSAAKNRPGEVLFGGDALRQRLEQLGLDLYISGHHAAYFPGKTGALTLLASGGLGGRQLLGSAERARSTVTVLDLDFAPLELRLSTFDAVSFEPISPSSLPERLDGVNGSVRRLDLAP